MNYAEAFRDITTCDISDACDALGIDPVTTGNTGKLLKSVYQEQHADDDAKQRGNVGIKSTHTGIMTGTGDRDRNWGS